MIEKEEVLLRLSNAKGYGSQFLSEAPLAIVILADPKQSDVWIEDASIATTMIMISAQSLDLGSCWIQIRKRKHSGLQRSEQFVKCVLGIPNDLRVLCMVAIGYANEVKSDKQVEDAKLNDVYLNRYGESWYGNIQ